MFNWTKQKMINGILLSASQNYNIWKPFTGCKTKFFKEQLLVTNEGQFMETLSFWLLSLIITWKENALLFNTHTHKCKFLFKYFQAFTWKGSCNHLDKRSQTERSLWQVVALTSSWCFTAVDKRSSNHWKLSPWTFNYRIITSFVVNDCPLEGVPVSHIKAQLVE